MNSTIILNDKKKCYRYSIRIRQVISNDFGNFNVCKVSSQTRRTRRISVQNFKSIILIHFTVWLWLRLDCNGHLH